MLFQEKKVADGFEYKCQDVFGVAVFTVAEKLDGDTLDGLISYLMSLPGARELRGTVKYEGEKSLAYVYKPKPTWDEGENEICKIKSTHTSILGRAISSLGTLLSKIRRTIINWLWRFVGSRLASMKGREDDRVI